MQPLEYRGERGSRTPLPAEGGPQTCVRIAAVQC
jgi:hypothetical protein